MIVCYWIVKKKAEEPSDFECYLDSLETTIPAAAEEEESCCPKEDLSQAFLAIKKLGCLKGASVLDIIKKCPHKIKCVA